MLLISPPSMDALRDQVLQGLKGKYPSGLDVIGLYPELAKDPEVAAAIRPWLTNPASGFRRMSALALHNAGYAEGILHITYNSLRVHPLLNVDYLVNSSWWYDVQRHASALTDECIGLLIQDMTGELPFFHGLTLALVPSEKVVPRMLPLLEREPAVAFYAAFTLAMHGRDEGRRILENAAAHCTNPYLACIALAKVPDENTLAYLRPFTQDEHPLYKRWFQPYGLWVNNLVSFLECGQDLSRLIIDKYSKPLGEFGVGGYQISGKKYHKYNLFNLKPNEKNKDQLAVPMLYKGYMAANFLALWGRNDPDAINRCLVFQQRALEAFFEIFDISSFINLDVNQQSTLSGYFPHPEANFPFIYGGRWSMDNAFIKGFRVKLEKDDYIRGATDWIINGERYRLGLSPEYTYLWPDIETFWSSRRRYPYHTKTDQSK